jgi:hypothetical protein
VKVAFIASGRFLKCAIGKVILTFGNEMNGT